MCRPLSDPISWPFRSAMSLMVSVAGPPCDRSHMMLRRFSRSGVDFIRRSARVPEARFAGPDVACETDWVAALAAERPTGLVLLTHHYYADGPAGAPHVTLAKLLHSGDRTHALAGKARAQCSRVFAPI